MRKKISYTVLEELLKKGGYRIFTGGVIADEKDSKYLLCEIDNHTLKVKFDPPITGKGSLEYAAQLVGLMEFFDKEGVDYPKEFAAKTLEEYVCGIGRRHELKVKNLKDKISGLK